MAGVRTLVRRIGVALAAAVVSSASLAAPAAAVRTCSDAPAPRTILSGQGSLESVIVDRRGRLFYSDTTRKAIMRIDRPGEQPLLLAGGIESPGGLAFDADGALVVGQGNSLANGALGNVVGLARLLRVDPDSGATATYAEGLSMGNGLVRGPDGSFYASDDAGTGIDRVRAGTVERGWASVISGNGLAIDPSGRWLYAAQTFVPAAIARVDLQDPSRVTTYARPGVEDVASGFDGLTIDGAGALYVAVQVPGEVWRVSPDRSICSLGGALQNASAVAVGRGGEGFAAGNVYAVGFSGRIVELPGVAAP